MLFNSIKSKSYADKNTLQAIYNNKFITHIPDLCYVKDNAQIPVTSCAIINGDGTGDIILNINKINEEKKSNIEFNTEHDKNFILFHEVSHCEFDILHDRFFLSKDSFNNSIEKILNQWCFSTAFRLNIRKTLSETFADTYASIILLYNNEWNNKAIKQIEKVISVREKEKYITTNPLTMRDRLLKDPYYCCDNSLKKVLHNLEFLKNKEPEQLKNIATLYASDSLFSYLKQMHYNDLEEILIPKEMNFDFAISNYAQAYINNKFSLRDTWTKQLKDHPANDYLKLLFNETEEWVNQNKHKYHSISYSTIQNKSQNIYSSNDFILEKIKLLSNSQSFQFKKDVLFYIKNKEVDFINTMEQKRAYRYFLQDKKILKQHLKQIHENNYSSINFSNNSKTTLHL